MPAIDPRLKKIKDWLKKNPAISGAYIAGKAGLKRSNFSAALSGTRPLPDKYLEPLEKELEKYGFKK